MNSRTRAERRFQRRRHILRKKGIIHRCNDYWNYRYEGVLSKGKIHCSCPLCSEKTSVQGYSNSDVQKFISLELQLDDEQVIGLIDSSVRNKLKVKRAG